MTGPYKIGLTMAGAISAGAYSAGVLDFLVEALETWQNEGVAEDLRPPDVLLAAFAGASAGSINASLGALAVAKGPKATNPGQAGVPGKPTYHVLPTVYDAWVAKPDLTTSSVDTLLSTSDLEDSKHPAVSILNCNGLVKIGTQALQGGVRANKATYLPEHLHVYLTLTNLRGVPYEITFHDPSGYKESHVMQTHADRAHFILEGAGSGQFQSPWAGGDPAMTIDLNTLPAQITLTEGGWDPFEKSPSKWESFICATLGSSGFPAGLRSRYIQIDPPTNYDIEFNPIKPGRRLPQVDPQIAPANLKAKPAWPPGFDSQQSTFRFTTIDGGAINNEPFDIMRQIMKNSGGDNWSMLLIDPFPEAPDFECNEKKVLNDSLLYLAMNIFPMFKEQCRFKPNELIRGVESNTNYWLIVPRRQSPDGKPVKYHIACGLLGGFGGFVDREFRDHDYELGRRNCQSFLANWFGVPQGIHGISGQSLAYSPGDAAIIPLVKNFVPPCRFDRGRKLTPRSSI